MSIPLTLGPSTSLNEGPEASTMILVVDLEGPDTRTSGGTRVP